MIPVSSFLFGFSCLVFLMKLLVPSAQWPGEPKQYFALVIIRLHFLLL